MLTTIGHLHGYREEERERLHRQARFFETMVHDRLAVSPPSLAA